MYDEEPKSGREKIHKQNYIIIKQVMIINVQLMPQPIKWSKKTNILVLLVLLKYKSNTSTIHQ